MWHPVQNTELTEENAKAWAEVRSNAVLARWPGTCPLATQNVVAGGQAEKQSRRTDGEPSPPGAWSEERTIECAPWQAGAG